MASNHQFFVYLGNEEMGLRSHLFFNELETSARGVNSLSRNHRDPYASDVVDLLSEQFSSMSLHRPKPIPVPPLHSGFKSFRPYGDQELYGESLKLDPFHFPTFRKNEWWLQSQQHRANVLQRQEARLHKRVLVHRNGNVLKESVGTGVFHPLQRPTFKSFNSVKKHDKRNGNQIEKELLTKEIRGVMTSTSQEQQHKDECHYHLPSDMDFSKDWAFSWNKFKFTN